MTVPSESGLPGTLCRKIVNTPMSPLLATFAQAWVRAKAVPIDQSEYQWVRIEAKTLETISAGLVLARLNPGATLIFEQTRINDEVWLPKRQFVSGSGRLALLKKLSEQQETIWSDYRKFRVDSKVVSTR